MSHFMRRAKKGANMVEYALLIALIAIVIAAILPFLTGALGSTFNNIAQTLLK